MGGKQLKSNSFRLLASSIMFSIGLFSLVFSFPILATSYGYSYSFIGFLGFLLALPFIAVAGIYTKLDYKYLRPGTVFSYAGSAAISLALIFRTELIFLFIYIVSSVVQAFWWITSEISLALVQGEGNAEKYSAGWGVPNAVVPVVAGIILQYLGFDFLFVAAAISFAIGLFFIPRYDFKPVNAVFSHIRLRYVYSLLFSGISMGFVFFVIVPVLKYYGEQDYIIGVIVGIFGASSAVGYVLMNFVRNKTVKFYAVLSAVLVLPTFLFGISHSVYLVSALMVSLGLGTSVAMSKILAYVSESASVRLGVFYYETVFGIGTVIGSLGGGLLFQYYGGISIIAIFSLPIVYIVALLAIDRTPQLPSEESA